MIHGPWLMGSRARHFAIDKPETMNLEPETMNHYKIL
jgi:hypothetical protein